jgi:hypothetical protein
MSNHDVYKNDFPHIEGWANSHGYYHINTGGGCEAWRRDFKLEEGGYLLLTFDGTSCFGPLDRGHWTLARCDKNDDIVGLQSKLNDRYRSLTFKEVQHYHGKHVQWEVREDTKSPLFSFQEGLNSEEKEVIVSMIQQRICDLEEEKDYALKSSKRIGYKNAFEKEDYSLLQVLRDVEEKLS